MNFRLLLCDENKLFLHFDFMIAKGIYKRTVNCRKTTGPFDVNILCHCFKVIRATLFLYLNLHIFIYKYLPLFICIYGFRKT